jgi:hypothetical protein
MSDVGAGLKSKPLDTRALDAKPVIMGAWILVASLVLAADFAREREDPAWIDLPPGRTAAAVAKIASSQTPKPPPADLGRAGQVPAVPRGPWSASTWESFGTAIAAENAAPGNAERRARLALLALEQRRFEDAWNHLAATSADPAWTAAILPRFIPGVPAGTNVRDGGRATPLPDGVVLAPSLPPASAGAVRGRIDRRAMSLSDLEIGAARVTLRVAVEAEGVQIDVKHVSGGTAKLAIVIPEPREIPFGNEYVDWYRQDDMHVAHAIVVKPGDEEHTLYGRFEPRDRILPMTMPARVPAQLEQGKLWLVIADSDPDRALVAAVATALTSTKLGFECKAIDPRAKAEDWSGTRVDLTRQSEREEKLVWLASAIERFALEKPAVPTPR